VYRLTCNYVITRPIVSRANGPTGTRCIAGARAAVATDSPNPPVFEAGLVPEHGENAGRAAAAILSAYSESEAFEPIEGIDDLISDLHGAGRKIGILANGAAEVEAAHLRVFVNSGMVTATVLAGRDGVSKPGRAAFELIAERLGVAVEDCYFIDDSEQNVNAARELEMSAFHFLGDVAELRGALVEAGALSEHDDTA
jgi:HAD superfamily hydrolase (TIGR01509 family)